MSIFRGAYLYRRCRNKRSRKLSDRIHDATGGKVRRTGSSEDGSSCSGQRDIDTDDTQHEGLYSLEKITI